MVNMQSSNIERSIEIKLQEIFSAIEKTNNEVQNSRQKILDLTNKQVEIYQKIATIYLLESPQNNDLEIQKIIKQLKDLNCNLKNKSSNLDHFIADSQQKMDETLLKLDELTAEKIRQLESDADYLSLLNNYNITKDELTKETKNFKSSQQEFSTKLKQYQQNYYYNYLINRRFGEKNYKAFKIFRYLDSWVARFINFSENFKNHKMLKDLYKESQLRFNNKKRAYEQALKAKERKEREVDTNLNLSKLKKTIALTEQDLAHYKKQKQDTENTLQELQKGNNSQFKLISNQLVKLLQKQSLSQLNDLTLQTKSTEDDKLLEKIVAINKQILDIDAYLASLLKTLNELDNVYNRFEQTFYLFRENNIPSSIYEYNIPSFKLNDLLDQLFSNQIFPETVVQTLFGYRAIRRELKSSNHNSGWASDNSSSRRSSSFSSSSSHSSSSSSYSSSSSSSDSSSSSSYSSSSDSGFSSSSSTGGGGFKTTDSF
ncbi:hypothetical protein [Gilliamella sp. B2911]|uniref:hypothetical protein n=1 Tax=Gilliamella sp. B2911 TaxID=2817980 RepID=UPI00226A0173|nr:hypothetical protein [Gilliamella sp. B2911]MCX8662829.1 hypothetical protein [Gilliamella sp. B2911]